MTEGQILSDIVNYFLRTEIQGATMAKMTNKRLNMNTWLFIIHHVREIQYWKGTDGKYSLPESLRETRYF